MVPGWIFMVLDGFLWLFIVPGRFLWFQVSVYGFSRFQVSFSWFQVGFMVIRCSSVIFKVPGGFSCFIMVLGQFLRFFFKVPGQFFIISVFIWF